MDPLEEQDIAPHEDAPLVFLRKAVEALRSSFVILWMILVSIVRACLPASILGRKSVNREVVLVTGSGSGLGRLLSVRFSKLGARLVLWDVNEQGNQETAALIREVTGGEVHTYTCDLSDREQIYKVADVVKRDVGNVDILVNNAGIVTGRPFIDCPDSLIIKTMEVNAMSHFWTTKAFLPGMMENDHGHVVSIASGAGLFGQARLADYCASKFAAVGFSESLSLELFASGQKGVHVTTVCPFYIDTGMFAGVVTEAPRILPILEPSYAADKIMDAVLTNQETLMMPRSVYIFYYMKGLLPVRPGFHIADRFGVTRSMLHFVGRQGVPQETTSGSTKTKDV